MGVISVPVETKSREFYGKMWLASNLLELGHDIVIGYSSHLHSWHTLKSEAVPDVHLEKSMTAKRRGLFEKLSKAQAKVTVLDAEGGIYKSKNDYFRRRVSIDTISHVDTVFAWGEDSAKAITTNCDFPNSNIIVSGNPRFDLLSPELRDIYLDPANSLRKEFGEYILVNTNFAVANHLENKTYTDNSDKIQYISALLDEFINLIYKIDSHFPNKNIIIRPHPSEDHELYKRKFSKEESIFVIFEGNVREWIMGAECVVHNGCTTGVESALLNVPVIAYKPLSDDDSYRSPVPNRVSLQAETIPDLIALIEEYNGDSYTMNNEKKSYLKNYFNNVDSLAAPIISEKLDELIKAKIVTDYPPLTTKEKIHTTIEKYPKLYRFVKGDRSEYSYQKFPGIDSVEILDLLNQFGNNVGEGDISIIKLNKTFDVYLLSNI